MPRENSQSPDDLNLEKGNTHLLFLNQRTNGYYQAKHFNYYVFKQVLERWSRVTVTQQGDTGNKGNAIEKIEEFSVLTEKLW